MIIKSTTDGISAEAFSILSATHFSASNPPEQALIYTNNTAAAITTVYPANSLWLPGESKFFNGSFWVSAGNGLLVSDIVKVSTTLSVSATTINSATLYSSPSGKTLNVTNIAIKVNTIVGTVTIPPQISIGTNGGIYQNIMTNTTMTGNVVTNSVWNQPIIGTSVVAQSGIPIVARINSAAVGASVLTYTIELYGNLI
jgi:hypothetical protein